MKGMEIYYNYIRKHQGIINELKNNEIYYWKLMEIYQGWQAYAKWANSFNLRKRILKEIHKIKEARLKQIAISK